MGWLCTKWPSLGLSSVASVLDRTVATSSEVRAAGTRAATTELLVSYKPIPWFGSGSQSSHLTPQKVQSFCRWEFVVLTGSEATIPRSLSPPDLNLDQKALLQYPVLGCEQS